MQRGWQPEHTWVVVVGLLEWQDSESLSSFPKQKRRDAALVTFFKQAGVPPAQISYLQDEQATQAQIDATLAELLPQAATGDLLFLYYCGHGFLDDEGAPYFAPYDSGIDDVVGWPMSSIPDVIDHHFAGAQAILAADCCYSGCLTDAVRDRDGNLAYACLTSSSASELSTGNWTFTECLLAGLRGQAFTDGDGSATITIGELAQQIYDDMLFAEEQIATFVFANGFDPQLVLAPAKTKGDPQIGRRVEAESGGEWYRARVIDAADGELLVHYYGYEESDDDWLAPERIREATPTQYAVGAAVEVFWNGDWYAATVLEARGGAHLISYADYDAAWNEWAGSSRIREPGQ